MLKAAKATCDFYIDNTPALMAFLIGIQVLRDFIKWAII